MKEFKVPGTTTFIKLIKALSPENTDPPYSRILDKQLGRIYGLTSLKNLSTGPWLQKFGNKRCL